MRDCRSLFNFMSPFSREMCTVEKPWVCREQSVERSEVYVLIRCLGWWLEGLQLCPDWLMVGACKHRHNAAV
jgi:hypothetical protein